MEGGFLTGFFCCLLCAAHSYTSHGDIRSLQSTTVRRGSYSEGVSNGDVHITDLPKGNSREAVALTNKVDSNSFVTKVFEQFGDGSTISPDGFRRFLCSLASVAVTVDHHSNSNCSDSRNASHIPINTLHLGVSTLGDKVRMEEGDMSGAKANVTKEVCPANLYHLILAQPLVSCSAFNHTHSDVIEQSNNMYLVWMYASVSIIVISLCGFGGVVVIPVMQKMLFKHLLQFLVALAVGTLCGDALLHLLPHAMLPVHSHQHSYTAIASEDSHDSNMWRGLVAMAGVVFMYFADIVLKWISGHQRSRNMKKRTPDVRVMRDSSDEAAISQSVGERSYKNSHTSYPYSYSEITTNLDTNNSGYSNGSDNRLPREENGSVVSTKLKTSKDLQVLPRVRNATEKDGDGTHCHKNSHNTYSYREMSGNPNLPVHWENGDVTSDYQLVREENGAVIPAKLTKPYCNSRDNAKELESTTAEHELLNCEREGNGPESQTVINDDGYKIVIKDHSHPHSHGYAINPSDSFSSVAWMVIMSDGFHNFADGMAIGAAFATNISGGFSTALAVFFHELPHELGDFAVLLQTGMSWRQALFYNLVSSILCFVGMCLGVFLGHDQSTTQWAFSAVAGMFLYIALVTMLPELSTTQADDEISILQCALHLAGLVSGVGTMLLIALYEQQIKSLFVD